MPKLRIDVDDEVYARLAAEAVGELRPIEWQAEVILRRAVGLPWPKTPTPSDDRPVDRAELLEADG